MRPPSESTARIFSIAASGVVKSITTSTPARFGAVSADGAPVFANIEGAHAVAALARNFGHQRSGLSFAENEEEHLLSPWLSFCWV